MPLGKYSWTLIFCLAKSFSQIAPVSSVLTPEGTHLSRHKPKQTLKPRQSYPEFETDIPQLNHRCMNKKYVPILCVIEILWLFVMQLKTD
jgi:hypothetical protein